MFLFNPTRLPIRRTLIAGLATAGILTSPHVGGSGAIAQDSRATAASADAETFDGGRLLAFVLERLKANFAYPELLERPSFTEKTEAVRADIARAKTVAEAQPMINALLGELKISHTAFYTTDDIEYPILLDAIGRGDGIAELIRETWWANLPSLDNPGVFFTRIDGQWFVDGVLEGSPAEAAGLKIGDEITDADGAALHPMLSFKGKAGRDVVLGVRRERGGTVVKLTVPVKAMVPSLAFAAATLASARVIVRGGKRIGYMHVWSSKSVEPFQHALAKLTPGGKINLDARGDGGRRFSEGMIVEKAVTDAPLDGLILDFRGKVGGTNFGRQYLEALTHGADAEPLGGSIEFLGRDSGVKPRRGDDTASKNPSFKGRAVMLIDHHARSALELEAYSFQHAKMGPLIGTTTAGAVSAAGVFRAPGNGLLYLAISRIKADGKPLEGIGVQPDIRVERPLPYANGADPVLEAALAHFEASR